MFKDIPKSCFEELDFDAIAGKLTWYDLTHTEYFAIYHKERPNFPEGTLLRSRFTLKSEQEDLIMLVGSSTPDGYTEGCGCCADPHEFYQVAFLSELLGGSS